jgi:hypothetical protein
MEKFTSLSYRLAFLGISIFFLSMALAGAGYALTRPVQLHEAIICALASPRDNPHWYPVAGIGTLLCGVMLFPLALVLYGQLKFVQHTVALAGLAVFAMGVSGGVTLCISAPFIKFHHTIHAAIAYSTFAALAGGISLWMALTASGWWHLHPGLARALAVGASGNALITASLCFLWFHRNFFTDAPWYRTVAAWEWTLTAYNASCLLALVLSVRSLQRHRGRNIARA